MHDGIAPQGQMELRLEAFQDSGLTDLKVESCSTVTAKYVYDDCDYYEFKVSPGSDGIPCFTWNQVTLGSFNVHTMSREHRGPTQTLAELLALDEDRGGILGGYWREHAMALIGLHEVAAAAIQEAIDYAVSEASCAASAGLTSRFQKPAEAPPAPDVDECFEAFQAACQRRSPYCDGIQMDWGHDLGQLPGVAFGLAPGAPEQILYQADPSRSKQLYLNGFWTADHCLEEDLQEQFPDDAWARLGARNAARDLLEIQRVGGRLMEAQRQYTLQNIDQERRERLLRSVEQGRPVTDGGFDWDKYTAEWLEGDLTDLFERVKEYLNSLKSRPKRPRRKRGPKPATLGAAQAATDSLT
jgi:hypothetical protein